MNSGEYKLMGLFLYREPKYVDQIKDNLIDIKQDGTFRLDMGYFKYHRGFRMTGRRSCSTNSLADHHVREK